jgi:hypothetical protein
MTFGETAILIVGLAVVAWLIVARGLRRKERDAWAIVSVVSGTAAFLYAAYLLINLLYASLVSDLVFVISLIGRL